MFVKKNEANKRQFKNKIKLSLISSFWKYSSNRTVDFDDVRLEYIVSRKCLQRCICFNMFLKIMSSVVWNVINIWLVRLRFDAFGRQCLTTSLTQWLRLGPQGMRLSKTAEILFKQPHKLLTQSAMWLIIVWWLLSANIMSDHHLMLAFCKIIPYRTTKAVQNYPYCMK